MIVEENLEFGHPGKEAFGCEILLDGMHGVLHGNEGVWSDRAAEVGKANCGRTGGDISFYVELLNDCPINHGLQNICGRSLKNGIQIREDDSPCPSGKVK